VKPRTRLVQSRVVYANNSAYHPRRNRCRPDTRARIVRNPAYHQSAMTYAKADESVTYVIEPDEQHEEYVIQSRPNYGRSYNSGIRTYRTYPSYGYNRGYRGYRGYGHHSGYIGYGYSRGSYGCRPHYGYGRSHFGYGVGYGHYGGRYGGHYGGHHGGGYRYGSGVSLHFRF